MLAVPMSASPSHHPGVAEPADLLGRLREDLALGTFRPRERLVEADLCLRYGVGRSAVRGALEELGRRGVVRRLPNKGATVHEFTLEELRDVCDLRVLLHRHAVETLPLPADPAWLDLLDAHAARHAAAVDARDAVGAFHANRAFHAHLFSAAPNRLLQDQIAEVGWLLEVVRSYRLDGPALNERAPREHAAICDAARRSDRARLLEMCLAHIPSPDRIAEKLRAARA